MRVCWGWSWLSLLWFWLSSLSFGGITAHRRRSAFRSTPLRVSLLRDSPPGLFWETDRRLIKAIPSITVRPPIYTLPFSALQIRSIFCTLIIGVTSRGTDVTITNETMPSSTSFRGLYSEKASSVVVVSIEDQGVERQVTVGYSLVSGASSSAVSAPVSAPENTQPNLVISNGTLNAALPRTFLVDPSSTILSSSDNPDPATGLHTTAAVFASGQSIDSLYKKYLALFSGKDWQVKSKTETASDANILAGNSSTGEQVNVQIMEGANGMSDVIVSVQTPITKK